MRNQYMDTGLMALDLANTWDEWLDEPELLPDVAALRQFCEEFTEPPGELSQAVLIAVREMRSHLRAVLHRDPPERTRALAAFAADLPSQAVIENTNDLPTLRLTSSADATLADRLAIRAVRDLLNIATAGDWERLRLCAASPCQDAFIDRSRPGRRQFCSTRCANRAHATASRARHRP
jgi:predicted RNA-binding Zn ribbon-like protein